MNIGFYTTGFLRELRFGELRVLAAALLIAVMAVTAVGFFTARVERAMGLQAAELLGADLVVRGSTRADDALVTRAGALGLHTTRTLGFPSVVLTPDDESQLIAIKAVGAGYPLRGRLRVSDGLDAEQSVAVGTPAAGEIWIEPRLAVALGADVGDLVSIGQRAMRVGALVLHEPDRGGAFFQFAPRVMMRIEDVASTGLVIAGSRVRHRLLVAGLWEQVLAYRDWVEPRLTDNQRLEDVREARPEMRRALTRGSSFLGLASLVTVLVTGAAIAVAAQRYSERQADTSAILRCLGASQRQIQVRVAGRLLVIGLAACLAGSAGGFAVQWVLARSLGTFFALSLPPPDGWPVLVGLATGLVTLAGFALPSVLRLRDVPVLRVLRRELGAPPPSVLLVATLAGAAMSALVIWQAGELRLGVIALAGVVGTGALLTVAALVLLHLLGGLRLAAAGTWRFGLANLTRHRQASVVQGLAFGTGLMALLLLAVVRVDVIEAWQTTIPADAPNTFIINIPPPLVDELQARLTGAGIETAALFPMIRGRLTAINDLPVRPEDYDNDRTRRLAAREFNLSWAEQPSGNNTVTAGRWWQGEELQQDLVSVEQGIAQTFDIELGDRLRFSVGGMPVEVTVSNVREVDWDSFRVNFFMITTPAALAELPTTFITAFHLPDARHRFVAELIRDYPSITVFDVTAIITQIRSVMDRATLAVEFVFAFTLLAGVAVLYAAVTASSAQRGRESALLKTLGASRGQVRSGLLAEFLALGLLSGLLAASAAGIVGYALAVWIFELDYTLNLWLWVAGIVSGTLGVGLAGWLATRGIVNRTPLETLRGA